MTKQKRLILSALPYVNNQPHLGNIVGCILSSDVYSRYCRKRGHPTLHICGTDEYGTAIEMAALQEKAHPKEICDKNHKIHKRIYDWFGIKFDNFGRTTSAAHSANTTEFYKKLEKYTEIKETNQFHCDECKIFLADRFVIGICPKCGKDSRGDQCDYCGIVNFILESPKCALCNSEPNHKPTKHIYLSLDKLQDKISDWAKKNWDSWSNNARDITREWIKKELHPRCITRDLKYKWGVSVPLDGFEDKVFYVWFDAPIGYISFTKEIDETFLEESKIYEFMGKDNVSFHSIFFPGMCLAGDVDFLPSVISSTEYLMFENQKFSKSKNIGIFGSDLIGGEYGSSSIWRYYLMKIRPETKDANFTFADFQQSVVSDLINNFGNYINRVLSFVAKKGKINYKVTETDILFIEKVDELYQKYLDTLESVGLRDALKIIMEMSSVGNEYIQAGISNKEERENTFSIGTSLIVLLGHMIDPYMPEIAEKIFKFVNVANMNYPDKFYLLENGHEVAKKIDVLFKHFTDEEKALMNK